MSFHTVSWKKSCECFEMGNILMPTELWPRWLASLRRTCSATVRSCTTLSASPHRRGSSSDSLSRACGQIRFQDCHNQHHQHQYDPCDHVNCQDPDSSSSGFQRLLDERQLSFCQHTLYRLHFDTVLVAYYRTRVRSLVMLVTHWLTDSLTD